MKYIPEKDPLYTGSDIKIKTEAKGIHKRAVKKMLEKADRPKPNSSILGLRPKLWFYNIGKDKKKGFKHWLAKKMGEPPVLFSSVDPEKSKTIMLSLLDSKGFFRSKISYDTKVKKKKASVIYNVYLPEPYRFGDYNFPDAPDSLSAAVRMTEKNHLINRDQQYNLDLLKQERLRIDAELKTKGYYFFSNDYLIFQADTTAGNKHVNISLSVKEDIPEKAAIPYYMKNIIVTPSHSLTRDSILPGADTVLVNNIHYVNDGFFRPRSIVRNVMIKPGMRYDRDKYNLTIKRLMGMGVFSFVNIKFNDTITPEGLGLLDSRILLTRRAAKSLSAEPDIVTKSNNYTGPAVKLSFKNRNFLGGAELLALNVEGSYEVQISGTQRGFNSYEFGGSVQLFYPRFLLPFRIDENKSLYVPKTRFEASFRLIHRMQLFDMANLAFKYGYIWKTSDKDEFEVDPVVLNFSKLLHTTEKFDQLLKDNSYLQRSFEEQFTVGSQLSYTHNGLQGVDKRHQYFYNGTIDLSGNLLSLFQSVTKEYKNTPETPYNVFGYRYSQYTKFSNDGRYYLTFDKNNRIATRLIVGVGYPYRNSSVMPYLKQFFSGGSNSIRAFRPRSVGPGSFEPADSVSSYFDQSGDMKLEGNIEYRFTIISLLKGALFLDAGNVWLINADSSFPGGEFHFNRFMKEIAVGSGVGFRVDISLFVIRFDIGIPLRKPNLPENERWVIKDINFGSPKWRRDNIILNIAIGYPF